MKNLSILLNFILLLAVAILYYLHFKQADNAVKPASRKQNDNAIPVKMPEVRLKNTPLVYVNADSLWENFEMVKQMRKDLERERKTFETKFEKDYHALETQYMELRDKSALLTQEEGMARQQELMQKEQKLGEYRQQQSERLAKLEADKTEKIQEAITSYLKKQYGSSKYAYILGYAQGGGILFANDSLEITDEVIGGLNATYPKGK